MNNMNNMKRAIYIGPEIKTSTDHYCIRYGMTGFYNRIRNYNIFIPDGTDASGIKVHLAVKMSELRLTDA